MRVRLATIDDLASLARMSEALFPAAPASEHARDVSARLTESDAAFFVAEGTDGSACGFVEIGMRKYADGCDSSPVAYIEAWYVDPGARRSGIGRALLAAAEDWARGRHLTEIASDTQIGNEISLVAHTRSGYSEVDRIIQFRKPLR